MTKTKLLDAMAARPAAYFDEETGTLHLPIDGKLHPIRFGMRVLRALAKGVSGGGPEDVLAMLESATMEAMIKLLTLAITAAVPSAALPVPSPDAAFDEDATIDLVESLPLVQQEIVWRSIMHSLSRNPFIKALQAPSAK